MRRSYIVSIVMLVLGLANMYASTYRGMVRRDVAADTIKTDKRKTRTLDTVVVSGDNITHYADKDVIRITREMRRGTANTAQLIGRVPGMYWDPSNNDLRYYGSPKVLILVDSLEKSDQYIKELHHARFTRIDVIPSPQGKYS